jgi:energy-coupling factor transporter ATP-binding protein EcfA2
MIRLEAISISNFRGIREGKVEGFADVNLMIGRNNCGKSTVAEAITLLMYRGCHQQTRDPISRNPADGWIQFRKSPGYEAAESWYKNDQTKPIELKGAVADARFAFSWGIIRGSLEAKESVLPDTYNNPHNQVMLFARQLTVFRPSDALNETIEQVRWRYLFPQRQDKLLTKAINTIFQMNVEHLNFQPDNRLLLLLPDYSLSLDVQGDGARSALRCLMMLTALQGTLFILEEPECHQHPGSLERFAEAVCRMAREQEVQLLISTHSMECVDRFVQAAKAAGSESAVFHLKLTDGLLHSTRLSADTLRTLEATGIDVRNLDLYG